MVKVFPHGAIEIKRDGKIPFKVNGQQVKHYMRNLEEVKVCVDLDLSEVE